MTHFTIKATLVFIEKERIGNISNIITNADKSNGLDFGFLSSLLTGNWLAGIILIAVVILFIIITVPLFPVLANYLISVVMGLQQFLKNRFIKTNKPKGEIKFA